MPNEINMQLPKLNHSRAMVATTAALFSVERHASVMAQCQAVIIPEVEAIRVDASGRAGVDMVIREFLAGPANRPSQLYIALTKLQDSLNTLPAAAAPLVEDANGMCTDMTAAANELCAISRAKVSAQLHAFFEKATLGSIVGRSLQVQAADRFRQDYANRQFGECLLRMVSWVSLTDGKNPAAEILRLYRAQVSHWDRAKQSLGVAAEIIGAS